MPLFETILLAADFSENSREAFRSACSLATEGKTRIKVLHVEEPRYVAEEPIYHGQPAVRFSAVERTPEELKTLDEELKKSYTPDRKLAIDYLTREGSPAEQILLAAQEFECSLIVVGTHGRTGLSRLLAGSVAEEVIRGAKCPVLALRTPEHEGHASQRIRCILTPIDQSESSLHAARLARSLAKQLGARLVLLEVAPPEVFTGTDILIPVDLRACRQALEDSRRELDGPDLSAPVEAVLRQGYVDSEILDLAKSLPCDLIVMGTHGRSGLSRLLMGSVTEAVLRRSSFPVLAVKPASSLLKEEAVRERIQDPKPAEERHEPSPLAPRAGIQTTSVRVSAEQLREAEANRHAHAAGPSIRDRMVEIGRGNQQAGRQGS